VFGVLALAATGGAYQTVAASVDRAGAVMPGQLIDVGGHRLYLSCTGSGSPTVVLESGASESSAYWGWIAPAVARDTTVCVYDRAGRGFSEPAPSPQDGVGVATDLHTLLERAHVAAPYVLVGHSSGGPYVRIFAARYPDQVAGMVLLDGQPPDALTKLPGFAAFLSTYRTASALLPSLARLGVFRLADLTSYGGLPAQARDAERATQSSAELARTTRDEFAELQTDRGYGGEGGNGRMAAVAGRGGRLVDQQHPPCFAKHDSRFAHRRQGRCGNGQPGDSRRRRIDPGGETTDEAIGGGEPGHRD
jgi:pimeloyl-ACP methyl ester carboxylesterase